jgi:simple sugar transport system permease protein
MSATTALAPSPAESPVAAGVVERPRSWKAPIALGVLSVLALIVFGILTAGDKESTFVISQPGDVIEIDPITVPSRATAIVLSLLCAVLAGYAAYRVWQRRPIPLALTIGFGVIWMLAFLVWAVAGKSIPFTGLLQGSLLLAVPLIFGALSGVLCERAAVINIAIEGQLLAGAFLSAVVASLTGNLWVGLIAAPVAGLLVAYVLAVFTVRYFVDQIIVGVVLNVLVIGITNFLYGRLLAPNQDTWNNPGIFSRFKIPILGDIPIIGPVLFNQRVIVYIMYVAVAVLEVALFRTRWGLRVRAVGEHPQAADTVGIKVNRLRFQNVLLGGLVAGLGGAFFTLGSVGNFSKEMTSGAGFIALAAMIFGRWSPIGAMFAALLFGFANNLQIVLNIVGTPIPSDFMLMAPYIATILAVAGLVGRVRAPAADGQPYIKS